MTIESLDHELYQELNTPEHLNFYLVGVKEDSKNHATRHYSNENEAEFDRLVDALHQETEVTPHLIASDNYQRDNVEQKDLFEDNYPQDSVLVVPDTYLFGRNDPTAVDRYSDIIDVMPGSNLEGIIHLDVENDLERIPGNHTYHVDSLINELGRFYRKQRGRFYNGTPIETDQLETALLSQLY